MKMTIKTIIEKKGHEKITMLTAFDSITAAMAATAGVDIILVGDSLANTALGHSNTLPVTLDEMLHHAKAVSKTSENCLVVFDMPFLSYQMNDSASFFNCGRALKEAGCHAVKMEGGSERIPLFKELIKGGIPVMGHLGLLPQHVNAYGGMLVQGRSEESAAFIKKEAVLLAEAGIFSLVLECVPESLAQEITSELNIPIIGIGAGRFCDGQVQVISDLLGMSSAAAPKHAKKYADFYTTGTTSIKKYIKDVQQGDFPGKQNIF